MGRLRGIGLQQTFLASFSSQIFYREDLPCNFFCVSPISYPAMNRDPGVDPRQEILRTAARLFQQQGYDGTSMNDIAAALKFSKGGLYHHFQSKDEILFDLMTQAMDITEQRVVKVVREIADPETKLRELIRLHMAVVLSQSDREITVMLHENHPLPPALRKIINARKKQYIHFVENLIAEVQLGMQTTGKVSPRAGAFALLGMINWIYQWYKPGGRYSGTKSSQGVYGDFFHRNVPVKSFHEIAELIGEQKHQPKAYVEFLRTESMSAGLYVLPAAGTDPQLPHRQDEMYYVIRGRADMRVGSESRKVSAGSIVFVASGVEHRFYDITEALTVLVFFAPAET